MREQRRLAAILVADVVGYSKLVASDEAGTLARLNALRSGVIDPALAKHSGRLFKSVGDGFLVEFASAVQAVTCAMAIQQANAGGHLPLRIGIHVGDVVVQGEDLMGDGINVAARIEAVADAGGIALSRQVHDQVRDRIGVAFEYRGEIELKNIARPVHVFAVAAAKAPLQAIALALPDKPSIAVLPFQNMSGDPEQEYFADGMVEDIITALSRFKSLFVIARNSIPAMKKTGFKPSMAGAIEAVLAPPVMGATAFVMAEFLNIPYAEVALAAAVPAALFYFSLFIQIDFFAGRHSMAGMRREEMPRIRDVVRDGWYFIFVIILLVVLLLVMKRENWAPWLATGLLIVLNQLFSDKRWGWTDLLAFIEGNGRVFVELVAILAGIGLLVGAFSLTGLTGTLTTELLYIAGGQPLLLILMGALTSFILGMGMTITACYIFLAVLLAPSLIQAGLDPLAVHMFIMYWGMVSFITPPVALAAFAAASVARSNPINTGLEAMKIGSIIYFVPCFFILNPSLVLQGSFLEFVVHFTTALVGVVLVCAGLQGYMGRIGDLRRCGFLEWPVRIALMVGGLLFAAPGGGLMPLSSLQMTAAALALSLPALAVAWIYGRRAAVA